MYNILIVRDREMSMTLNTHAKKMSLFELPIPKFLPTIKINTAHETSSMNIANLLI